MYGSEVSQKFVKSLYLDFFSFFSCTLGIRKFLGQGLNSSQSCDLCHTGGNTGSLTCYATEGTPRTLFFKFVLEAATLSILPILCHTPLPPPPTPGGALAAASSGEFPTWGAISLKCLRVRWCLVQESKGAWLWAGGGLGAPWA